jgi:tripartite ATP-independent transporter DctM subunit
MNYGIALVPIMFLFMFAGVPVFVGIGLAVLLAAEHWNLISLSVIFQQFYQGIDSYALLAIVLFMFAGNLMMELGLVDDLLNFCRLLVGRLHGGLAYVDIVANVFFAAISGSAVADMSAIGTLLVPKMEEEGYDTDFSSALTAAASVIGPIIPPSIPMVVYASIMGTSVGAMFLGGVVPGVLLGVSLCVISRFICKKHGYGTIGEKIPNKEKGKIVLKAIPAILMPVIILGGIFSGTFTPTEAAAIACLYSLLIGFFYYRNVTPSLLWRTLRDSMVSAAGIYLIIGIAKPFSWLVAMTHLADTVSAGMAAITDNKFVMLLILNLILLILGCLMESTANILIFAPLLIPIATAMGVDPLHIGVIFVLNLMMGVATPPFGICLFIGANQTGRPLGKIFKAVLPLVGAEIIILLICTYLPFLVTGLPRLLGY